MIEFIDERNVGGAVLSESGLNHQAGIRSRKGSKPDFPRAAFPVQLG
jgi:hypothetical protein